MALDSYDWRKYTHAQARDHARLCGVALDSYDWGEYTAGSVVVGESFHSRDLSRIMAGVDYADPGHRKVSACAEARLVREPDNPHDRNAVAVVVGDPPVVIGHINRTDAAAVAPSIEEPVPVRCRLTKHRDGKFSVALDRAAWENLRTPESDAHKLPRYTPIASTTAHADRADLTALAPGVPEAFCSAHESATRDGEDWEQSVSLEGRLVATGHRRASMALAVKCRGKIVAHVARRMKLDPAVSDGTSVEVEIVAHGECGYLPGESHTPGGSSQDDDSDPDEDQGYCTRDFKVRVRVPRQAGTDNPADAPQRDDGLLPRQPPPPGMPPPAWYSDPEDMTSLRYWNGQKWTEHRTPLQTVEAPLEINAPPDRRSGANALSDDRHVCVTCGVNGVWHRNRAAWHLCFWLGLFVLFLTWLAIPFLPKCPYCPKCRKRL